MNTFVFMCYIHNVVLHYYTQSRMPVRIATCCDECSIIREKLGEQYNIEYEKGHFAFRIISGNHELSVSIPPDAQGPSGDFPKVVEVLLFHKLEAEWDLPRRYSDGVRASSDESVDRIRKVTTEMFC